MTWKDWPYWLKGAIILGLLNLLIVALSFISQQILPDNSAKIISIVIFISYFGIFILADILQDIIPLDLINSGDVIGTPNMMGYVVVLVLFIIVGALFGWIYGKIKQRKQENQKTN